jgi:hypothetical protein
MSASDGNGRCDWIDFRDALDLAAKPKLDRSITYWRDRLIERKAAAGTTKYATRRRAYLLSAFAVISYTSNPIYVAFAALGSWLGAFASVTFMHRRESAVRHDPP